MSTAVETKAGVIQGVAGDGLVVFRGVPYAAAPEGDLRFRPPQPAEPWSGVRSADAFCVAAPQPPAARLGAGTEPEPQGEACLALNIWTPACDSARRPVMVWIHGGAFRSGSGASPMYAGGRLARAGDVVVVTINYRLGALGFLAHPDLADPDTGAAGNWGLLDQQAALQWVQDHIEGFGGDPSNVTVFGESAGSISIANLLASPGSHGLFQRAICQSGGPGAAPLDHHAAVAERLAAKLGVGSISAVRTVPVEEVLAAQVALAAEAMADGIGMVFAPTIDGTVLPDDPFAAISGGSAAGVDLIAGTNLEEMKFWLIGDRSAADMDDERLAKRLRRAGGEQAVAAIDVYRRAREARGESTAPVDLWVAIESDRTFRIPALRMLDAHRGAGNPARSYLFTWRSPALGGFLGACHALEIPFVFGTARDPGMQGFTGSGEEAETLSDRMVAAWLGFAQAGDPSVPGLGPWPGYQAPERATVRFDARCEVVNAPMETERAFWDA